MGLKAYQFNASIQSVITQLTELRISEKEANQEPVINRTIAEPEPTNSEVDENPATMEMENAETTQLAIRN